MTNNTEINNFLLFHRVLNSKKKIIKNEDIDVKFFIEILEYIKKFNKNKNIKKNYIIPTFDDGNLSDFELVLNELKLRNLYSYFFIIPKLIGKRNYLTWDMVINLNKNKMIIGSHSFSHINLVNCSLSVAKYEMEKSKEIIENKLNKKINSFSFPYGEFNFNLINLAKEIGYKQIFTSRHGISHNKDEYLKRNSLNKDLKISDVKKIIDAEYLTKLKWFLEDNIKYPLRRLIGKKNYLYLRLLLTKR